MAKDFRDLTPQEADVFLLNKTGLNLYPFAAFLREAVEVDIIYSGTPDLGTIKFLERDIKRAQKNLETPNKEIAIREYRALQEDYRAGIRPIFLAHRHETALLKAHRGRLINLKKKIIKTMSDHDAFWYRDGRTKRLLKEKTTEEYEDLFANEYELESFFNLLNGYVFDIEQELSKTRRGSPIKKSNLLVSLWACFLNEKTGSRNWALIGDLLDWFWQILSPYRLYRGLMPPGGESDIAYFQNQFYKSKAKWEFRYGYYRHRSGWELNGGIVVLGQEKNEINFYNREILNRLSMGDAAPQPEQDNKTFLPFVKELSAENPNLKQLIVFPDYSYLLI